MDTKEKIKSNIDMNYPAINHIDASLDIIYLSIDVLYPKSTI